MTLPPRKTRRRSRSAARAADGPPFSTLARGKKKLGRNKKRSAKNFEWAYHSVARIGFVGRLPCANCGLIGSGDWRVVANAHTKNDGGSRKGHYTTIVPLCNTSALNGCHDKQHGINGGWSRLPRLNTPEKRARAAAKTERMWQEFQSHLARSSERPTGE